MLWVGSEVIFAKFGIHPSFFVHKISINFDRNWTVAPKHENHPYVHSSSNERRQKCFHLVCCASRKRLWTLSHWCTRVHVCSYKWKVYDFLLFDNLWFKVRSNKWMRWKLNTHTQFHDMSLSAKQNEMLNKCFIFVQRSVPILRQTNLNFITFLRIHIWSKSNAKQSENLRDMVSSSSEFSLAITENCKMCKKNETQKEKPHIRQLWDLRWDHPTLIMLWIWTVKVLLNHEFY